jgi:DNA-directed RNA polymerase specialized sigma24 family protein
MSAKSLSEVVYSHLFPGGMIPFACKDSLPGIDARIGEIEQLARGQQLKGEPRRLTKRDSLLLTDQIIQLRDSCNPPMNYREIMHRLGDVITSEAARNRYDDAKKAREAAAMQKEGYAALSGNSDHIAEPNELIPNACDDAGNPIWLQVSGSLPERPTIRNSQIVEKSEEVAAPTNRESRSVEELSEVQQKEILDRYEGGSDPKTIATVMGLRRAAVQSVIARHNKAQKATAPSQPGVEGAQEAARANPRGTPEEEEQAKPGPEPKSISRAELDGKIWAGHKEGKTPKQISDELCSEGYYYGEQRVRRMLMQQGADL